MTACTRYHTVDRRLARWLMMSSDRAGGSSIHLTHDFLARMLGVRRVGITLAAGVLHRQGLIEYRRGEVRVLRRRALASAACSCYARDKRLYEVTLGATRPR
jgi:CRP-like cAMP-binding protein